MNKHRTSMFCYHSVHPSLSPSPVLDTAVLTDCSQQIDYSHRQTCHRNNHNSGLIQYDEISKTINDRTSRKRPEESYHRSEKQSSLVAIYINNILLILIRLMILFLTVLILSLTSYYAMVYIYSKPKKTGWEQILHWLYQE